MGWVPDLADHRDCAWNDTNVVVTLQALSRTSGNPQAVDWRDFCGPIENQQDLSTSPAHACIALIQHFERRSTGRLVCPSRLFLHRAALRMERALDGPLSLRPTLKACAQFGLLDEKHWPYGRVFLTHELDGLTCCMCRQLRGLRYVRLDDRGSTGPELLERLRSFLAAGFCFAFGFSVHGSITVDADIWFPSRADSLLGGQAVIAVGYDNKLRIRSDRGAFLIRNSWGTDWGNKGYGWLPYSYVTDRLALDFWTLIKPSWLRSEEFGSPFESPAVN